MKAPTGFRGIFTTDDTALAVYSEAAGINRIKPRAVAVPYDAEDAQTLVRWAALEKIPVIPRGSGSSMAGGAIGDGVVLDLSRMNRIGEINADRRTVMVGPGAVCARVNEKAAERGLRFPVDPSSAKFCTIGGMASTNASGAHTLKYGSTRAWIVAIDCVFADGTRGILSRGADVPENVPAIGRFLHDVQPQMPTLSGVEEFMHQGVRKDSSGYGVSSYTHSGDLIDLMVGSEGTLAVFVGLELKLDPLPVAVSSVLAEFDSLDAAVDAARLAAGSDASACELLDRTFLEVAGSYRTDDQIPEAILLAEVEAQTDAIASTSANMLAAKFKSAGATVAKVGISPVEQSEIWELRHAASPILGKLDPRLKSMQIVEDGAVPPEKLGDYVRGLRTAFRRQGMRAVIFGHAGDAHVHANPLVDMSDAHWAEKMASLFDEVVGLTVSLGGTLTGEHGDGRLRAPFLGRIWSGPAIELFEAIKQCFDPAGILNPGVKFALADRTPDPVKFDMALEPMPEKARAALDHIADKRTYDDFRLSLIEQAP